jgi:hypothetical protein
MYTEIAPSTRQLTDKINSALRADLDEAAQHELAELINLLPELEASPSPGQAMSAVDRAVSALLVKPPKVKVARSIRRELQEQVDARNSPMQRLLFDSPAAMVMLGLATFALCAIVCALYLPHLFDLGLLCLFGCDGLDALPPGESVIMKNILVAVTLAGTLGSIVSILERVQKTGAFAEKGPLECFFTGLFKPMIGMVLGPVSFAIGHAGIVPIAVEMEKEIYFFPVLAFITGFSERFWRDLVRLVEHNLTQLPIPLRKVGSA